jgi:hypothetical protein
MELTADARRPFVRPTWPNKNGNRSAISVMAGQQLHTPKRRFQQFFQIRYINKLKAPYVGF